MADHDVSVSCGLLPGPTVDQVSEHDWHCVTDHGIHFGTRGVGKFLVRNGNEVLIQPETHATDRDIRPFVLGSAVGYLLHQRGSLPLHGSSVAVDDGCVLFLGRRGAGKSTLAALLNARGYPVVCDDISAVQVTADGDLAVAPGFPNLKLWRNSVEKLGADIRGLKQISNHIEKYAWPVDQSFAPNALPLKRIYVLGNSDSLTLQELSSADALPWLRRFTYRRWVLQEMGLMGRHFELCGQLAARVPTASFQRPRDLASIEKSVDFVERDFQSLSMRSRAAG
ncbi:MAG: hypothetical protein ACKVHE_25755 [Planctomycetales bacterium]